MDGIERRAIVAAEAALRAGSLLRRGFGSDYEVKQKGQGFDLVTEYDHLSERIIIETLRSHYPEDTILAEESGAMGDLSDRNLWIVDPLDGTINFAHSLPLFAVSVAAVCNGEVVCSAIYQPITQELFLAQKGQGATLNGEPLSVSTTSSIEGALIATSLSFHRHQDPALSIKRFARVAVETTGVAALGSAVMNLSYLAAGRYDAYWTGSGTLQPWDIAAASLLVQEAGGTLSQLDGSPIPLLTPTELLATNKKLHPILIERLTKEK